jgi:hypothetical protein
MTYFSRERWKRRFLYLAASYKLRLRGARRGGLSVWKMSAVVKLHVGSLDHALGVCEPNLCPAVRLPGMIEQVKRDRRTATRKRLPLLFSRRRPS